MGAYADDVSPTAVTGRNRLRVSGGGRYGDQDQAGEPRDTVSPIEEGRNRRLALRLGRPIVAGRAAGARFDQLLDVGLGFLLRGRIVVVRAHSSLRERIFGGREKAGEIPARRILAQPLFREIQVLRTGTDEIATEAVEDRGADLDGTASTRSQESPFVELINFGNYFRLGMMPFDFVNSSS
jgi:hypothetical protein